MRKIVTVIVLMIGTASFGYQTTSEWSRYTSREGRYSVLLPGQPQLKSQEETAADGTKVQQYLAFASDSAGAVYVLAYFDTEGRSFSFDKARDGALSRINGTLISERPITLKGSPGREVKLIGKTADNAELFVVMRFYLVQQRVFVVQFLVAKSAGQDLPEKAVKFFDSFQVETH